MKKKEKKLERRYKCSIEEKAACAALIAGPKIACTAVGLITGPLAPATIAGCLVASIGADANCYLACFS